MTEGFFSSPEFDQLLRFAKGGTLIRDQWYWDDMYLKDDLTGEVSLFVRYFVEYSTKQGKIHRRFKTSVLGFPNDDAMREWIKTRHAIESADPEGKDRGWIPDEWVGAKR